MIWRILKIVFVSAVIVLILMWLFAGGFVRIGEFVKNIPNPIDIIWGDDQRSYGVQFPWQIETPRGPDISGLAQQGDALAGESYGGASSYTTYETSQEQVKQQAFGSPSPLREQVRLSAGNARESDARLEYLEVSSRSRDPISLSGWSLQSVLSGTRVFLPNATTLFRLGEVNTVSPVTLQSGEKALVSSGPSPVGVSFKESRCTGYLAQMQRFEPSLSSACPASQDLAPLTAENLQRYGSQCMDYARSLPSCTFPTKLPAWITPGCMAYVQNTFSYKGCVNGLSGTSGFLLPTWRLYLNSSIQFWDDKHDIIRLLDAQGLTVDAISY